MGSTLSVSKVNSLKLFDCMKIIFRHLCFSMLFLFTVTSCYYTHTTETDHWTITDEAQVDSVKFSINHHYWCGYNFEATDSLELLPYPSVEGKRQKSYLTPSTINRRDPLVVAQVVYIPTDTTDSVWVKVARDQLTQGWIQERTLLKNVVPNDPISKFIYHFSDRRAVYVIFLLGVAILFWLIQSVRRKTFRLVHFRDIPSFYPTLLCLCVSGSAVLYGSMQRFVPMTWVEFYYHPTLNPFNPAIPFILALFLFSVWFMLIVAVAVVEEMRRQDDLGDRLWYLSSLAGVCMVLYLVFTLTTPYYIGYPLLFAYWVFAIRQYWIHRPTHMLCGFCHKAILHKGKCPYCGAINE